jgi:hypothetical protein
VERLNLQCHHPSAPTVADALFSLLIKSSTRAREDVGTICWVSFRDAGLESRHTVSDDLFPTKDARGSVLWRCAPSQKAKPRSISRFLRGARYCDTMIRLRVVCRTDKGWRRPGSASTGAFSTLCSLCICQREMAATCKQRRSLGLRAHGTGLRFLTCLWLSIWAHVPGPVPDPGARLYRRVSRRFWLASLRQNIAQTG